MKIHFISDTHFQHEGALTWAPERAALASTTEELDELMIERWNSVVRKGDRVYHLGDVFFGPKERFQTLWPRLNGSKRLILGNHDDTKFLASGGFFKKITMWRILDEHDIVLSHTPQHPQTLLEPRSRGPMVNVHGHTHGRGSPDGPYLSVCVERRDFYPVELDQLVEEANGVRTDDNAVLGYH